MYDPKLDQIEKTLSDRDFPKIFAVELNADCNLACAMCHHGTMRRPKGVLPLPLFQRCADQIAAIAPQTDVWFSFCGEPLLSPDRLFECLEYGAEVGLQSLNINTNAMKLTKPVADRLVTLPVRMLVAGVDAFSADVFESLRVNAVRDEVYQNVEYLLDRCRDRADAPEVVVQFIEMENNVHELEEYKRYWLERGATVKVRNMLSWGGQVSSPLVQLGLKRIPCPWALTMMHVFWDGRVPRCPGDTEGEEGAGNAWDEPLVDLWARLGDYRNLHLARRFDELPDRCSRCTDWMTGASVKLRPSHQPQPAEVVG